MYGVDESAQTSVSTFPVLGYGEVKRLRWLYAECSLAIAHGVAIPEAAAPACGPGPGCGPTAHNISQLIPTKLLPNAVKLFSLHSVEVTLTPCCIIVFCTWVIKVCYLHVLVQRLSATGIAERSGWGKGSLGFPA